MTVRDQFKDAAQVLVTSRHLLRGYQERGVWVPVQLYDEYKVTPDLNEAGMVINGDKLVYRMFAL